MSNVNMPDAGKANGFVALDDELLPPINEAKRFVKIFFLRKIVRVAFVLFVLLLLMALLAPMIAPYGENEQNLYDTLKTPSAAHLLGTDSLGRDLLTRIIYGSRIAFMVGIVTSLLAAAAGTAIGMVAGYRGGALSSAIMRGNDTLMSIPGLVLAILITSAVKAGIFGVVIAVAVAMLPGFIRLVNGQVMSVKQNDYIMAEHAAGARTLRILAKHVLPNIMAPLIVQVTMTMGAAIMIEAGLSFIGIGITPPTPAWGAMCYDGYKYIDTIPTLSLVPGVMIMLLVFSLNMIGDGLRDALDPKLRGTDA